MLANRALRNLLLACSLFIAGCDPVRTTLQPVRLQVVDSTSGQVVVGAQVSLAFDLAAASPLSKETELTPEEWKQRVEAFQQPWFRGATTEQGQVDLDVEFTSLDRTSGPQPPSGKDFVTGQPYRIKVKVGEAPEEEMSLVMKRGATITGKSWTVTVLEIDAPRYVATRDK
jgi:hypothetical protein